MITYDIQIQPTYYLLNHNADVPGTTAEQILLTLSNYNVQFEKNVYYIYLHLPVSLTADKMTTFDPNQPLLKHHMTLL